MVLYVKLINMLVNRNDQRCDNYKLSVSAIIGMKGLWQ